MEVKKEVKTIKVDYECPKCKNGHLRNDGMVLTSFPAQYPHRCDNRNCDYGETFHVRYPYMEYI